MPTRINSLSALIAVAAAAAIVPTAAIAKAPAKAHALTQCADANLLVTNSDRSAAEAAEVCLINQQRAAHGLPTLRVSTKLDRSAQGWSNRMVSDNTFSHGSDFSGRISAAGFKWTAAGENIAAGFTTPFSVVHAWMDDVGHCQNILRPMFDYVGTGLNAAGNGGGNMADTWTQDFGRLAGTSTGTDDMRPADGCPYKISESPATMSPKPTLARPASNSSSSASASSVHATPAATENGPTISW